MFENNYQNWLKDPTPSNMAKVMQGLDPVIKAEASRYGGGPVMETRAKSLAVGAIRSFNPQSGNKLSSWVINQMRPLSRYKNTTQTVRIPEVASARAYEINLKAQEYKDEHGREPTDEQLADFSGISKVHIKKLRDKRMAALTEGSMTTMVDSESASGGLPSVESTSDHTMDAAQNVYETLNEQERLVYDHTTGLNNKPILPKKDIADLLGVSAPRVSTIASDIAGRIVDARRLYG